MIYPEHLNEFWRLRRIDASLTNTDFVLYGYLCDCLNQVFWSTDRITQPGDLICGLLKIHPETLEESRNRLKQKGFIDFISKTFIDKNGKKRGVKGQSVTYIVLDRHQNRLLSGSANRVYSESIPSLKQDVNINRNIKEKLSQAHEVSVALEDELKALIVDTKPGKQKVFTPPSPDEVKAYFTERTKVNGKVSETFAEKFIAHYEERNWTYGRGNKLKDWKRAVISWNLDRFISEHRFLEKSTGPAPKKVRYDNPKSPLDII